MARSTNFLHPDFLVYPLLFKAFHRHRHRHPIWTRIGYTLWQFLARERFCSDSIHFFCLCGRIDIFIFFVQCLPNTSLNCGSTNYPIWFQQQPTLYRCTIWIGADRCILGKFYIHFPKRLVCFTLQAFHHGIFKCQLYHEWHWKFVAYFLFPNLPV